MATITPSPGAIINATTIEGQVWQLAHWVESAERNNQVEGSFSLGKVDFVGTLEFSLPATSAFNTTSGLFTLAAGIYSPATFSIPAGGTIKSTSFAQYFLDTALYLAQWQSTPAKNPQAIKNVELALNLGTMTWSGTIAMPYILALGPGGAVSETAVEWLLT